MECGGVEEGMMAWEAAGLGFPYFVCVLFLFCFVLFLFQAVSPLSCYTRLTPSYKGLSVGVLSVCAFSAAALYPGIALPPGADSNGNIGLPCVLLGGSSSWMSLVGFGFPCFGA